MRMLPHISTNRVVMLVTIVVGLFHFELSLAKKTDECEVCVKFMTKFIDSLTSEQQASSVEAKTAFYEACKTAQGKEERFCYHVGGSSISATSIVDFVVAPIKSYLPPTKICEKIKGKIPDICELKYDKPIDLSNLNKLKVKDLKKVLGEWGKLDACKGCLEKQDYIKAVEQLIPVHAPEFVKKKEDL